MDNGKPEKNSEIWFKYCEECAKTAYESLQKREEQDDKIFSDASENIYTKNRPHS